MANHYVDTAADAGGDGTTSDLTGEHCAWDTIADVNAHTFEAGDFCLFKRGCTWAGTTLTLDNSGSAGNVITWASYGVGNAPIIQGTASGAYGIVAPTGVHHLLIQDFHVIDNTNLKLLAIAGHDITVEDCEADSASTAAIWVGGAAADVYNVTITRCTAHNGAQGGIHVYHSEIGGPTDIIIQDCTCYSNGSTNLHHGIYIKFCERVTIRRNVCYSNYWYGIKLGAGANNSIAEDNLCYSNEDGIAWNADDSPGTGNTIRYNICYENDVNNILISGTPTDGFIYNNTLVNSTGRGFNLYTGTGMIIKNNVFYQDPTVHNACPVSLGVGITPANNTFDYNCLWFGASTGVVKIDGVDHTFTQWQAETGSPDAHGIHADPLLNDVATQNFHLLAASPCINAGVNVGLTEDFEGNPIR